MSPSLPAGLSSGRTSSPVWQMADPLGLPGAPHETLQALRAGLDGQSLGPLGRLILVTERQGERERAGYAAVLVVGRQVWVSASAFGPRYGQAGAAALAELVHWAQAQGLTLRETVLNASDVGRVLAEPEAAEIERLLAASNPTDPGIYTRLPRQSDKDELDPEGAYFGPAPE